MKKMTPKERVDAFFHNQPVDEIPTDEGMFTIFNPAVYQERPDFLKMREQITGKDWFGVEWRYDNGVDAIAPDHTKTTVLEDICDWRDVIHFPDIEACDWDNIEEIEHLSEIDRESKVVELMFVNGPFERLHMLMGFENALCSLITEPEEVEEFFDAFMEWKIRLMEKVIEYYKPDVLMFHDDWGTQNGMFFSPEIWRKLLKPQIKKAVDRCHELGVIFEIHSCGKIEEIVPEFVELGIDAWAGMEINDIPKLKHITGMKLGYHVSPDFQKYYVESLSGSLEEEELRARVREIFYKTAEGYCYYPCCVPYGGWSTQILFDEIAKCGKHVYQENC